MRKDKRLEKFFNLTPAGIIITAVVLLALYLSIYVSRRNHEMFLAFIAPAVLFTFFLSYNCLLVYFHKIGFYRPWQAAEFYKKCSCQNISIFQDENFEKAKDIYFSVFGTDKYLGEDTLPVHMAEIYDVGRKITEKDRG